MEWPDTNTAFLAMSLTLTVGKVQNGAVQEVLKHSVDGGTEKCYFPEMLSNLHQDTVKHLNG